ncbi:MAG: P-loop NTPase [Aeromicrobium sp.]
MTDVLLVAVDRHLVNRISAIDGYRVVSLERDNVASASNAASMPDFRPDVIFVGPGLPTDRAIEYGQVMSADFPEISVILVAGADRELVPKAAAVGLRGVISERIGDADLAALMERLGHQIIPVPDGSGPVPHQVVVVASPKGGVGKTTVAINVAAELAKAAPGEVVLIDLDLQFGDVATMLDLAPANTVSDAFRSGVDDSMRLRTLLLPHPSQFHVLCGSDDPAANGRVTGDQIRKLVSQYSSTFRYVIVDTPAGLHEETLASLEEATDVIIVATLDVATLRDVRREVDVLANLFLLPPRRHIVLNRTDGRVGLTERDAERILGLPVDAVIPASDRVALAANGGKIVVELKKRNPAKRPLRDLARRVADLNNHQGEELLR